MRFIRICAVVVLSLLSMATTQASNLLIGAEIATGSDKFIDSGQSQNLRAGDSDSPSIGYNFTLPDDTMLRVELVLGGSSVEYTNAEEEFFVTPINIQYLAHRSNFVFGAGITLHTDIEYTLDIFNQSDTKYTYDNAFGLVGQIAYIFNYKHELGLRGTIIDYKGGDSLTQHTISANNYGFFYTYNFRPITSR